MAERVAKNLEDGGGAPQDYEALAREWFGYVRAIVAKSGIHGDDVEDVAQDILLRFYARDFLAEYDPGKTFDTPSGARPARFKGFLGRFVRLYVRQHLDRQYTRARKEPVRADAPVRTNDGDASVTMLEAHQEEWLDSPLGAEELAASSAAIDTIREFLAARPVVGKRDLLRIFDWCREMVARDGAIDRKVIRARLGVSDTAVSLMMAELRAALAELGVAPDSWWDKHMEGL